jgi:hypothetical protein
MESGKNLLIVGLIALIVSLIGTGLTYSVVSSIKQSWNSGYVSYGNVSITVEQSALINFTQNFINISNGVVNEGSDRALIDTSDDGTVTGGTFTIDPWPRNYMLIENIGNVNVTLNLTSDADATEFIGGSLGGGPLYRVKISNNNSIACVNSTMGDIMSNDYTVGTFVDITSQPTIFCDYFKFESQDGHPSALRLDVFLGIPKDSKTGILTSVITGAISAI